MALNEKHSTEDNVYAVFYGEVFQSVLVDSLNTKSIGTFIARISLFAKKFIFKASIQPFHFLPNFYILLSYFLRVVKQMKK